METGHLQRHLDHLRIRNCSPETIRQRQQIVRRFFRHIGTEDPSAVTIPMLTSWQGSLARYSPQTVATYTSHVRAFFEYLSRYESLPNPAGVLVRPKIPRRLPRPIAEDDLELSLRTADCRVRAWITLSAYAGLRAAEIARLRREDVVDSTDPPVLLVMGKGQVERSVPASETVLHALREWGLRPGWLFPGRSGRHVSPGTVTNRVSEHLRALGLDAVLHQGRHRFLTQVYGHTRDLRLTQELAGHRSPATTANYTATSHARAVEAVRKLDEDHDIRQRVAAVSFLG